jgi:regulator of RNase E activity RraA
MDSAPGVGVQASEMTQLTSETRDQLKRISTATLMSCLFKRGLRNQYIQDVRPLNPEAGTMVGEAFTLRYMPAREDLNPMTVFQNPDHPQRRAVELCPPGAVLVMDSRKDARAASAGSILVSRLMVRGVAGVVVLPAHLAAEIAIEATGMTAFEDFVTEEVLKGRSIIGLYPATHEQTHADFEAWRLEHGR